MKKKKPVKFVQIAAGDYCLYALDSDGIIWASSEEVFDISQEEFDVRWHRLPSPIEEQEEK